jgi:ribonuclease BN (tRNA processing enzyme)
VVAVTSAVEVLFAGAGDAFGSGGRLQAAMCLSGAGPRVLVDCGATALVGLKRGGVDPNDVHVVVVTHLHGDHYAGIPFLILDGQFRRRDRNLTVVGPAGTRARLRAAMDVLYPGMAEVERRFAVHVVELQPGVPAKIEGAIVTGHEVVHASGAPALGLQLGYGGRTIAYTGDTEWTAAIPAVADGAELLVAEAYTWNRRIRYHLDWETLSSHRAELRCGQLALTHMSDDMLTRISDLPADVIVAHDGMRINL